MESIFSDHKEKILKAPKGIYLVQVSAKLKSEKQLGGADDEDLRYVQTSEKRISI